MAKPPAPKARSSKVPLYAILGIIVVLGGGLLLTRGGGGSAAREPLDIDIPAEELTRATGITTGREDAPVVMYEFADFQCPACGQFATFMMPLIRERLIDTGLVRYVYYDFPLVGIHPHAFLAARAARCANDQGRFWEYHDWLYSRQAAWSALRDPSDFFVDLAADAGLEQGPFESCLRSDRFAEEVTRSLRMGEALQVQGTPTVFVNMKRLPTVPPFAELEQLVRAEAGQPAAAESTGEAGAPADPAAAAPAAATTQQ